MNEGFGVGVEDGLWSADGVELEVDVEKGLVTSEMPEMAADTDAME